MSKDPSYRHDGTNREPPGSRTEPESVFTEPDGGSRSDWPLVVPQALLAGRYRVVREIGQGGEGRLYACLDEQASATPAVVKVYARNAAPDERALSSIAAVEHPGLLRLLAYGHLDGGWVYEVSEYASGGSLAGRKLPAEEIETRILPQVVAALRFCHAQRIVHRDLKPANLLFRDREQRQVVISDFGLSSMLASGNSVHYTDRVGRTWVYAAPETMMTAGGRQIVSPAEDCYSLGMTILALLLGREPYNNLSYQQLSWMKVNERVTALDETPPRMRDLLGGLLHPVPRSRWTLDHVEKWLRGDSVPVPDFERQTPAFRYNLAPGLEARSIKDLARQMVEHVEAAAGHVMEGILERALGEHDRSLELAVRKIRLHATGPENAVAETAYTLDTDLPFKLRPGVWAATPPELARVIDADPASQRAGLSELFAGRITIWLIATGRPTIAQEWVKVAGRYAASEAAREEGLEHFLHILDSSLPLPSIAATPPSVDWGSIESGNVRTQVVRVTNSGRGHLAGTVTLTGASAGLTITPARFTGAPAEVTLSLNTSTLQRGRSYRASIEIASNAGRALSIPVKWSVAIPATRLRAAAAVGAALGAGVASLYRAIVDTELGLHHGWLDPAMKLGVSEREAWFMVPSASLASWIAWRVYQKNGTRKK